MKIQLVESSWRSVQCDVLLVPVFQDENWQEGLAAELDSALDGLLTEMRDSGEWKGEDEDLAVIYRPSSLPAGRLILLGVGKEAEYDGAMIRKTIARAVRKLSACRFQKLAVFRRSRLNPVNAAQAAVEGVVLGTYEGDEYKTEDRSKAFLEEILFVADEPLDKESVEKGMRRGRIEAEATNLARALVNEPGNRINPSRLADKAREVSERFGLEIEILSEPELTEKGMEALLAVARGSDEPARLIVLKHMGAGHEAPVEAALVGKGVTFDSGGLSLKSPASMENMKSDKAGACAVLGAMQAIAQLQVPKNVIGIIPAVENMPSGRAQRPGDVVRSMSGKTIEVLDTDAEGRLILADALWYATQFKPKYIVDLATLTGACVVALGTLRAGLFSNDEALCESISRASERAGEKLWRLPLDHEYRKDLESSIADIKNIGERWGGAITAAKFLEEFIDGLPWCHLDIAGVDLIKVCNRVKIPTGFGVRTLVELVAD